MSITETREIQFPKWLAKSNQVITDTSTITPGNSPRSEIATIDTGCELVEEELGPRLVPEQEELGEDIYDTLDNVGATNEFIAESLHTIASQASRTTAIGYGEDLEHIEVPDWHARLAAVKQIAQLKGLKSNKNGTTKKRDKQSVYVLVP